jgi:hypothetical protein
MGLTVAQAIAAAIRQIIPGYSTSSGDWSTVSADAMQALNLLLQEHSLTPQGLYKVTRENFTLTAADAQYTIGPGGDFSTVRPLKIERAFTRSDSIDYPIEVFYGSSDYADEEQKTLQDRPASLYMEQGPTTNTLFFYPTPDAAYDLHIWSYKSFDISTSTSFAYTSTSQSLGLPHQYEPFIKWNLAQEMAEELGKPVPQLVFKRAQETLEKLKRFNAPIPPAINTDPLGHIGGYDIDTDMFK